MEEWPSVVPVPRIACIADLGCLVVVILLKPAMFDKCTYTHRSAVQSVPRKTNTPSVLVDDR